MAGGLSIRTDEAKTERSYLMEIHVIIDEGGIFQGCYVSPELSNAEIELIDFVTDDEDEFAEAERRYDTCVQRALKGELKVVY